MISTLSVGYCHIKKQLMQGDIADPPNNESDVGMIPVGILTQHTSLK